MKDRRRNPYMVLGIDFGASPDEATRAFAKVSRLARRSDSKFPYTMAEATAAEAEIRSEITDPESSIGIYRVPANPAVFADEAATGVLAPEPKNLERTTEPSDAAVTELEAQVVAHVAGLGLASFLDRLAPGPTQPVLRQ